MIYTFADLQLDTGRRQLTRESETLKLSKLSFKVLVALIEAAPDMLSHEALIDKVWGSDRVISTENLAQRVTLLRQTLGEDASNPTYIETVYGQGFRLIPSVKQQAPFSNNAVTAEEGSSQPTGQTGSKLRAPVAALAVIALAWLGFNSFRSNTPASLLEESSNSQSLTIAVLPFVNMSEEPEQEYFTDGLTEEILNSLAKQQGLMVTGRTSSFAYKNQNKDLREIGEELSVDYLLEGSVRKDGDAVRITAQLIDASNGSHLFSEVFNRQLTDVFSIQEEISQQVAANLNITLINTDGQYNQALKRLDAVAIEQLYAARAKIEAFAGAPIREALEILSDLNQQYPNTPEILGLIARGQMAYGSTGYLELFDPAVDYYQLAKDTLELDPTNLDALNTVAVTADDSPPDRANAIQYYQRMIRHHPGRMETYWGMLSYLSITRASCEEILSFLDSFPKTRADSEAVAENKEHFNDCVNQTLPPPSTEQVYNSLARAIEQNPNQRFLAQHYSRQLMLGAFEEAAETQLHIEYENNSFWVAYSAAYQYLYNRPSTIPLRNYVEFLLEINYGNYLEWAVLAADMSAKEDEPDIALNYLQSLPKFPIGVTTVRSAIGLMMLQLRTGENEESFETASTLVESLNQYHEDFPGSYPRHRLARYHFVAAFYAGDFKLAEQILQFYFEEDHLYWLDNIAVARALLEPWPDHPLIEEYLGRIMQSQQRAREELNIQ